MPEKKLSRDSIRDHLRKWLWLYVLGIAALCLANRLIYEVTRPRIPAENTLSICLIDAEADTDAFGDNKNSLLACIQAAEPSILDVKLDVLPYNEGDAYSASTLMQVKLVSGEADIYIASQAAYQAMLNLGACLNLDPYFESGQLSGTPVYAVDAETGERFISAMELSAIAVQAGIWGIDTENCRIIIAANGSAIESTLAALEAMIDRETN